MSRIGSARSISWIVIVASVGMFLYLRVREVESVSAVGPVLAALPFEIFWVAFLVLAWIGPFPESWPLVGKASKRSNRITFWFVAVGFGAFWLLFYTVFVFDLF